VPGEIRQLCFLEKNKIRGGREELRKYVATFDRVTKTSYIPTANSYASIH
jgi:hypothetical protein